MSQLGNTDEAAAARRRAKSYSITLSLIMGVGTLVVGLLPVPWVFLVGVFHIGILILRPFTTGNGGGRRSAQCRQNLPSWLWVA